MEGAVKNLFVFTLTSTGAVVTVTVGPTGEGLRLLFMMIITDIGHLEALVDGRLRALKPTFQAMTRIGSPEQIVTVMATVYGSHYLTHNESSGQRRTLLLNMILSLSRTPAFDGPIRLVR